LLERVDKSDTVGRTGKVPEEQIIELWEAGSMRLAFNLKDIDAHGLVYTDGEFGSLELEPTQPASLLYIAEKKKSKEFLVIIMPIFYIYSSFFHKMPAAIHFISDWNVTPNKPPSFYTNEPPHICEPPHIYAVLNRSAVKF
jgi:hypothetical protein